MSRPTGNPGRDALKVGELVARLHDNAEPSEAVPPRGAAASKV
jgi:hypothetical protein